ncbi:MAG: hypothetical protein SPD90_01835, partial [Intestinibacter sp.]|uniref:hypothetical protein n=1 Tax=Intestinibacter sp. TaxID=1965304 RepID=UPI002A825E5D
MKLSKQKKITAIAVILSLIVVGVVYGIGVKSKQEQVNNNVKQEDENQEVALLLEYDEDLTANSQEEIIIPVKLSYL